MNTLNDKRYTNSYSNPVVETGANKHLEVNLPVLKSIGKDYKLLLWLL
jgi:hypothetical protein